MSTMNGLINKMGEVWCGTSAMREEIYAARTDSVKELVHGVITPPRVRYQVIGCNGVDVKLYGSYTNKGKAVGQVATLMQLHSTVKNYSAKVVEVPAA